MEAAGLNVVESQDSSANREISFWEWEIIVIIDDQGIGLCRWQGRVHVHHNKRPYITVDIGQFAGIYMPDAGGAE